jgi:hypothetical protein
MEWVIPPIKVGRSQARWNSAFAALAIAVGVGATAEITPRSSYPTSSHLRERMALLAGSFPGLVQTNSLSPGADLPLLILGGGTSEQQAHRPGLLIVAGIEPNDLAGPVSALAAADALLTEASTNDAKRSTLESIVVFVVPRLTRRDSGWHQQPAEERQATDSPPVDDDHDGWIDEDPAEDLDGDGRITSMRIMQPAGEHLIDSAEPRLLFKADPAKGEVGAWRLLPEGTDNDHDEAWNEDPPGGVNLNRNFPFNFRFFGETSGKHPLSETESRALADFVIAHPNIAVVFTFGAVDNLTQPPKAEAEKKRPITAVNPDDLPWFKELGHAWRQSLLLEKELPGTSEPGALSDWIYFHRGRLSLAGRAWFPGLALAAFHSRTNAAQAAAAARSTNEVRAPATSWTVTNTANAQHTPDAKAGEKTAGKPDADKEREETRAYLRWLDTHAPGGFVQWNRIEHPDFPGQTVETGGFAPWARTNPPESLLAELARRHAAFLVELAGRLPRVEIRETIVKPLGNGVFDVEIEVANSGFLPTVLAHGEVSREVTPTRAVLHLEDATFISGSRSQRLGPLAGGGGNARVRWVIMAPAGSHAEIEVISAMAGRKRGIVPLTESQP